MKQFCTRAILLGLLLILASLPLRATEGMWLPLLLGQLNEAEMQAMGMKMTAEDIYSVNKSSLKDAVVQFGGGCTGEIISNQGLLLTNHHCGFGAIQYHSSVENDYLKDGFWAMSQEEELPVPNLTAMFIVRMEDVTKKILEGVTEGMTEQEREKIVQQNMSKVKGEATKGTHYGAIVKPFFYGKEYYLFVTETFTDVRLVGAPPSSIGKFGGDTDNWVWPRHTGDFSIFRVYAGADNKPAEYSKSNKPFKPRHHLPINLKGVKEGDFSMVFGFPGTTEQYLTAQEVEFRTERINPARINLRRELLDIVDATMARDAASRIKYAAKQARIANAYKKWIGQNQGLKEEKSVQYKKDLEKKFTEALAKDPEMQRRYGDVLPRLRKLHEENKKYDFASNFFIELYYYGGEITRFTREFFPIVNELETIEKMGKLEDYQKQVRSKIKSHFKDYDAGTDQKMLAIALQRYSEEVAPELLPEELKNLHKKYKGDYKAIAAYIFEKSKFTTPEGAKSYIDNPNPKKLKKDPAYRLAKSIFDAYFNKIRPQAEAYEAERALLMRDYVDAQRQLMKDKKFWPNANSTLRVAYGKVSGSSPRDGMAYLPFTTLDGIMQKYIPGDREFDVPQKLIELYEKKDYGQYAHNGKLPVAFTASNHTTGGNSGSPVIDGEGRLIGLNFDRSWESTMSDLHFVERRCRNIAVDVRYILWCVDKLAGAGHLVEEMTLVK